MDVRISPRSGLLVLLLVMLPVAGAKEKRSEHRRPSTGPAIMWQEPADIESRDLFFGSGGKEHVPHGTFTFVKEDLDGTSPKFVVRDEDGKKWKVKLGLEARPETAAARIVWAVGFYTNEDYFVPELQVHGMPDRLKRGQELVGVNGLVRNARLKREPKEEKKVGNWMWRHDAFTGTRELNGLKVVMAVINNWDLKDENNAIYQEDNERIYLISDLGASFASAGRTWPREKAKGNIESYKQSKFIRDMNPSTVDFAVPARPRWVFWVNPKEYWSRIHLEYIGKNVPREDARWMGRLMARLSPGQIRDAFRAAGYSPQEADEFAIVVEHRIAILTDL